MTRSKWPERIAAVIADLECVNDASDALTTALGKLDDMMLEALEPMERKVFEWTWDLDSYYSQITSTKVASWFQIKQNHASMILNHLCKYGLLDRREVINEYGKVYIYNLHRTCK